MNEAHAYLTPPEVLGQIVEAATRDRLRSILQVTPRKGRPGRPDETADIAALANRLKKDGLSWQQCFERCVIAFGEDRVGNVERVRAIWRRHFGKKKKKQEFRPNIHPPRTGSKTSDAVIAPAS